LAAQGFTTASTLVEAVDLGASLGLIATETNRHLDDSVAALELGLDLLIEKPMAINGDQALKLKTRAEELGRSIYVACVLRFSESLNTFKSMVPELGRVHSVRVEGQSYMPEWQPGRDYRNSFRARKDGGGVLLDLVHEIDYAGWIFGWPQSVQAKVVNTGRLGIEADEAAHLMWESPGGIIVSLTIDFLSRPTRRRMVAFGEEGTLTWDGVEGTVVFERADGEVTSIEQFTPRDQMFIDQAIAFVNTASGTLDSRLSTAEDGTNALAVCDAARIASESKREQPVKYS
jgi:predicted dehydrogenase